MITKKNEEDGREKDIAAREAKLKEEGIAIRNMAVNTKKSYGVTLDSKRDKSSAKRKR